MIDAKTCVYDVSRSEDASVGGNMCEKKSQEKSFIISEDYDRVQRKRKKHDRSFLGERRRSDQC